MKRKVPPPRAGGWVIDASVTLPWFFSDEAASFTEGLLDRLGEQDVWAPALWVLECTNALLNAERRGRIGSARRIEIVEELGALPVHVDHEPLSFAAIHRLAVAHGLTAYDSAYLELALRRSLTLVSMDARLVAAARAIGHPFATSQSA